MIINLKLNLGDGSLYGNANINNDSSFEINIQEGIDSTTIIPNDLNANPGQAVTLFNSENGNLVRVTSFVIQIRPLSKNVLSVITNSIWQFMSINL